MGYGHISKGGGSRDRVTMTAVLEAVDMLTEMAEQEESMIQGRVPEATLNAHFAEKVMATAKDAFRVILNYLRIYYKKEYGKLIVHESAAGIGTIMSLVSDAAKRLDAYSRIGANNILAVQKTEEYRQLDIFYHKKIEPIAALESLEIWIQELPIKAMLDYAKEKRVPSIRYEDHVHIDHASAIKDTEYELFYIKKEDGSRFFSPRLIKQMKLDSHFIDRQAAQHGPIEHLQDMQCREKAQCIFKNSLGEIDAFLKAASRFSSQDLVLGLYKAIVALMLAGQKKPKSFIKSSPAYFSDFIKLMRALVISHDYQRCICLVPASMAAFEIAVVQTVQALCHSLVTTSAIETSLPDFIAQECGNERNEVHLSTRLTMAKMKLEKIEHENAFLPIIHILESLQDPEIMGYDPALIGNIAGVMYELPINGKKVEIIRLPTPTYQEYMNRAQIIDEWKANMRRSIAINHGYKHIIFNFQDRTSWKEYARVKAMEDLANDTEFSSHLSIVTLAKAGEFYQQTGPYAEINSSNTFINHLLEHIESTTSGFWYSDEIRQLIFPRLVRKIAHTILKKFFSGRNVLSRSSRLDFIELFYVFLERAIIQETNADAVSFVCKDGLDSTLSAIGLLSYVVRSIQDMHISPYDENYMKSMLFGLPLVIRGRSLFEEPYARMINAMKVIESILHDASIPELKRSIDICL